MTFDSQMEHIKEKLGKIHPSNWKCSLHSTQSEDKDNNEHSPGVVTTCFLSLESPSDFVSNSLGAEKTKEDICQVYNFYQSISNIANVHYQNNYSTYSSKYHLILFYDFLGRKCIRKTQIWT